MVALAHPALGPVHRTAEADTDPADGMGLRKSGRLFPNLSQDPGGTSRGMDLAPGQGDQGSFVSGTDTQLELGPADFDAQEHGVTKSPEVPLPLLSVAFADNRRDRRRSVRPRG